MNMSVWAINRPAPVILLFLFLTFIGLNAFPKLPIQNMPDLDLPTVNVTVSLPGAAPTILETEVARRIEDSLTSASKLKHVSTSLSEGTATLTVEFELSKDTQEAVNDVRDAVSRVRGQFPAGVLEPQVSKLNVTGQAILTYAVKSDTLSELDRSWLVDDRISKAILAVPGVAQVTRQGGLSREISVTLIPERLQALGVTAAEVSKQLVSMQQEAAGGRGTIGEREQTVRTLNMAGDVEELAAMHIALADGRKVRLDSLAELKDTSGERSQQALLDGKPVVSFQVFRSTGYSEVAVGDAVRKAVAQLNTTLAGVELVEVNNSIEKIREQFNVSMETLIEGALLAIIVVWLFLRDVRATVVAAVALPLSVIPTFYFLHLMGLTLNGISLLALTLVIGVLVDDAIVEVENIVRHMQTGMSALKAAKEAATEIGTAVIATTFTLVAVFLPTAFMDGVVGKFFKQFGWTAAIAVLVSLLVARLLTPLMAAHLLKAHAKQADPKWMGWYMRKLDWVLHRPWKTLGLALVFLIGSFSMLPFLETGFVPRAQLGKTQVALELTPGSSYSDTSKAVNAALAQIAGVQGITQTYATIGVGQSGGATRSGAVGEVRKATIRISVDESERDIRDIEKDIRSRLVLPGVRVSMGAGGSGETYSVVLSGNDPVALANAARAVEKDLRNVPGLGAVSSTASILRPELVVRPDSAKAAEYGVTTQAIAQTVRVATAGDTDTSLAKLNLPERQLLVRVQMPADVRSDLGLVGQLRVPAKGGSVPLYRVADISLDSGPAQLTRYDRKRNVTLSVELAGRPLGEVARTVSKLPSMQSLPDGVAVQPSGDAERMKELVSSFGGAMLLGVLCIYAVLVLLLHNFAQPFTILSALPLAMGGALSALLLGNFTLSLPALIGILMLMGVVTKNSILLVDYATMSRAKGPLAAMRDACHKRARPILMTSIAMVAGMLPMALGIGGGDSSFRTPMAVVVIGGLVTSTLLSLLVVPAVFLQMAKGQAWLHRLVLRYRPAAEHHD